MPVGPLQVRHLIGHGEHTVSFWKNPLEHTQAVFPILVEAPVIQLVHTFGAVCKHELQLIAPQA